MRRPRLDATAFMPSALVLFTLLISEIGCVRTPPAPAAQTPGTPIDVAKLEFDNANLARRFRTFTATASEFAREGFAHRPFSVGGNFVTAEWTKKPDKKSIELHRIAVDTIVVPPPGAPMARAKAAALDVEMVSADPDQWCLRLTYRESTPQGVTGPGWSLHLYRWDPAKRSIIPFHPHEYTRESLRMPIVGYSVADTTVAGKLGDDVKTSFLRYVRSAETLRDAYLEDLADIEKKTMTLIEGHQARKKVYGKASRPNLPPPVIGTEPLTAEEEKAELTKAKQFFATRRELVRKHHQAAYTTLRQAFPLERCWPELAAP